MSKVGIIANPYSGRDLRRLTTRASNISHNEKTRKVLRIIHALEAYGIEKVYLMPDSYNLNSGIVRVHEAEGNSYLQIELLDYLPIDKPEETIMAADMMVNRGIGCLIVLGGDGTNRLVARCEMDIPVISVSTGTNNVYPSMLEETTAGIAAAYLASGNSRNGFLKRSKRIEVYINDELADVALVDASVTEVPFIGSKVVPGIDEVKDIVACRCGPDLIGSSSVIGSVAICEEDDDFGYHTRVGEKEINTLAAFSSGQIVEVYQSRPNRMHLGDPCAIHPDFPGTIALDGERTLLFRKNDELKFVITRKGPIKGNVREVLYQAVRDGFFMLEPSDRRPA